MFGIGFGEMLVIGVLILIAVGPDKLPSMIRTVAKTYRQLRRAATEIRASTGIDDFLRDEELRELAELRKQKLLALAKPPPAKPGAVPVATGGREDDPRPGVDPVRAAQRVGGLTLEQRHMEHPPQGVDIAELQAAAVGPVHAAPEPASLGVAAAKPTVGSAG